MKNKIEAILNALDCERVYGILLAIIGIACLVFSSFAPIVLDVVTVTVGIFLLLFATARSIMHIANGRRELTFFAHLMKEALLIFIGISLIILRSNFASTICTVLGIYMIIRSVIAIILTVGVGTKEALTPMEKGEIAVSIVLIILGLLMIIFPRFSNLLTGIILTLNGFELVIKSAPHKTDGKKDNYYITDQFVDKSDE